MHELNSPDYYRRREHQELKLAEQAVAPDIRAIHLELAQRYADLVRQAEAPIARPRLSIVARS